MDDWGLLGLTPTTDRKAIKRAYAQRLKKTRPEDDAEAYQQLREAYDRAIHYCKIHAGKTSHSERSHIQASSTTSVTSAAKSTSSTASTTQEDRSQTTENTTTEVEEPTATTEQTQQKNKLDERYLAQQKAYRAAEEAMAQLLSAEDYARPEIFSKLMNSDELLNLMARNRFEYRLLDHIYQNDGKDINFRLARAAAEEFHWFKQQYTDPNKHFRINHIEQRMQVHNTYRQTVLKQAKSGSNGEARAARMLMGDLRPMYFHIYRFLGFRNNTIRDYIKAFSTSVENGYCPELDTPTFHWWQNALRRSLFTLWHVFAGLALAVILFANIPEQSPLISSPFSIYIFAVATALISLSIWGADWLIRRYAKSIAMGWKYLHGLPATSYLFSLIFAISVIVWGYMPDRWYFDWPIIVALTSSLLIFGFHGTIMILIYAGWHVVLCIWIDTSDSYPELSSYALIVGFIAHKLFLNSLVFMPRKIASTLSETSYGLLALGLTFTAILSLMVILPGNFL